MATGRGKRTRFNRDNRIRARDNIKVKHISMLTPYVVHGESYEVTNPCLLLEVVIPITGVILNIETKMRNPVKEVKVDMHVNDLLVGNGFDLKVEKGDIVKVTLTSDNNKEELATSAFVSIAILPIYDKKFIVKIKVDEE
jgi:hypothetical protein